MISNSNPLHLNATSSFEVTNHLEQTSLQNDLTTQSVTSELSKMVKTSSLVTTIPKRTDLTSIKEFLNLKTNRVIDDNSIKKSLPRGSKDQKVGSGELTKYQTLRFERSTKKIIHVMGEFNRITNMIGTAQKYLKKSVKNIANASIQLYERAKMINQKYSIGIGDQTKNLTQLDKGGMGTISINAKRSIVFKKFSDSASAKEANKECQFSLDIHAKVKKKGLSSVGLPPKVQLILGLNGEVKGMKQTAFSEAGLHKYMENTLKNEKNNEAAKSTKLNIASQMLEGFATFDMIDFCHLDIKPANILIDKKNDVITAGFGDLGSAIDFSSTNVGKIIRQIKEVKFSDSHVNKNDKDMYSDMQNELVKIYENNPKDANLEKKLDEMKALTKGMSKHALGMTLAQLYYTKPEIGYDILEEEGKDPVRVQKSSWYGIAITKKEAQNGAPSIESFLEEDAKLPDIEQKCPIALRELIEKLTNPKERDDVSFETINDVFSNKLNK